MTFNHGLQFLLLLHLHGLVSPRQVVLILITVSRELLQHHVQPRLRALLVQITTQGLIKGEEETEGKEEAEIEGMRGKGRRRCNRGKGERKERLEEIEEGIGKI